MTLKLIIYCSESTSPDRQTNAVWHGTVTWIYRSVRDTGLCRVTETVWVMSSWKALYGCTLLGCSLGALQLNVKMKIDEQGSEWESSTKRASNIQFIGKHRSQFALPYSLKGTCYPSTSKAGSCWSRSLRFEVRVDYRSKQLGPLELITPWQFTY